MKRPASAIRTILNLVDAVGDSPALHHDVSVESYTDTRVWLRVIPAAGEAGLSLCIPRAWGFVPSAAFPGRILVIQPDALAKLNRELDLDELHQDPQFQADMDARDEEARNHQDATLAALEAQDRTPAPTFPVDIGTAPTIPAPAPAADEEAQAREGDRVRVTAKSASADIQDGFLVIETRTIQRDYVWTVGGGGSVVFLRIRLVSESDVRTVTRTRLP